ncbi:hypothetical protein BHE74_00042197 [Ensete ventricosum]|nr:hypothetical protein BHE74_00042197 [Ensete ventricosum]RZS06601.1 hypothetical protein BHM03_00037286 [Ensete ventricosum]
MQVMNGEYNEMIERDLDYRANLGGRNPRARRERFDQPRSRWWEPQHRDWLSGALVLVGREPGAPRSVDRSVRVGGTRAGSPFALPPSTLLQLSAAGSVLGRENRITEDAHSRGVSERSDRVVG